MTGREMTGCFQIVAQCPCLCPPGLSSYGVGVSKLWPQVSLKKIESPVVTEQRKRGEGGKENKQTRYMAASEMWEHSGNGKTSFLPS
jgi:hypothetical protein